MSNTKPISLMDEVRAARDCGEITCSLLARTSGRSYSATNRALRRITDVTESDAQRYYEALHQIRTDRWNASPAHKTDHQNEVTG